MGLYKSQNNESKIVIDYFKGREITLLDVGANNGFDLSNSYDLIQLGNKAYLVEPSSVFKDLKKLHKDSDKVKVFNFGLSFETKKSVFYESGNHVPNGTDKALVSSIHKSETERWVKSGVEFKETEIDLVSFEEFYESIGEPKFNFISIDTEGNDWNILKEIDLKYVGCECLCIEWNGDKKLKELFSEYVKTNKMKLIHQNSENLIFAR